MWLSPSLVETNGSTSSTHFVHHHLWHVNKRFTFKVGTSSTPPIEEHTSMSETSSRLRLLSVSPACQHNGCPLIPPSVDQWRIFQHCHCKCILNIILPTLAWDFFNSGSPHTFIHYAWWLGHKNVTMLPCWSIPVLHLLPSLVCPNKWLRVHVECAKIYKWRMQTFILQVFPKIPSQTFPAIWYYASCTVAIAS